MKIAFDNIWFYCLLLGSQILREDIIRLIGFRRNYPKKYLLASLTNRV